MTGKYSGSGSVSCARKNNGKRNKTAKKVAFMVFYSKVQKIRAGDSGLRKFIRTQTTNPTNQPINNRLINQLPTNQLTIDQLTN
jgi:hypothetical protein